MKRLVLIVMVLLLASSITSAQDFCKGDFTYDGDVDSFDLAEFLNHFGRGVYLNPCPLEGPAPLPRTGQTTCWNSDGVQRNCTGTGEDGEYQKGLTWPNPRFTDNGDGTVKDNLTNLIWLKSANCFGTRTWNNALSDCNGLADGQCGLTDGSNAGDWRLPNHKELFSLIDPENNNPALPSGHPFINVQSSTINYWSSTTYSPYTPGAWYVGMDYGDVNTQAKTFDGYVWPVRDDNLPPPRFTDNGDGTVTDNDSGLVWLKDAHCPLLHNDGAGQTWDTAMLVASALASSMCDLSDGSMQGDWRLPTSNEFQDFMCEEYFNPAVCDTVGTGQWSEGEPFNNVLDFYWSSTEYELDPDNANVGSIKLGGVFYDLKTSSYYVWPVRDP